MFRKNLKLWEYFWKIEFWQIETRNLRLKDVDSLIEIYKFKCSVHDESENSFNQKHWLATWKCEIISSRPNACYNLRFVFSRTILLMGQKSWAFIWKYVKVLFVTFFATLEVIKALHVPAFWKLITRVLFTSNFESNFIRIIRWTKLFPFDILSFRV